MPRSAGASSERIARAVMKNLAKLLTSACSTVSGHSRARGIFILLLFPLLAHANARSAAVLIEDKKYLEALDILIPELKKNPNDTEIKVQLATVSSRLFE